MAKKDKKAKEAKPEGDGQVKKAKSAKVMLAVAAVLAVASIGGGFYFAKYALQKDAEAFEPEFAADEAPAADEHGAPAAGHGADAEVAHGDKGAEGGHEGPAGSEAAESASTMGLLPFDDLVTNIRGFDLNGRPVRSYLKMSIMMVYKPELGAEELLISRQPFTRDLFNVYIRSLTEADIRGGAGILVIKSELLRRARAAAGNDLPTEILITDLIVN